MSIPHAIFLVGFAIYVAIRGVFEGRTKNVPKTVRRTDAVERFLFVIVGIGNLLVPVVFLLTPWFDFADVQHPTWVPACGTIVMVLALWLFWRSHVDLGVNWSMTLEIRDGHELVGHGVYRRVRHPMYAAIWLFGTAQAMLLDNWLAGWSAVATFAVMYFVRTPREERLMCDTFGDRYRQYMARTGRLLPRRRRRAGRIDD